MFNDCVPTFLLGVRKLTMKHVLFFGYGFRVFCQRQVVFSV